MSAFLALRGLSKRFGAAPVLHGLDLMVDRGTVLALLGASGCGKTTLLRLVAGFEQPDAGTVTLDGVMMSGPAGLVPAQRRGIGLVPQDGALFPHLSVGRNVGFGLPRGRRAVAVEAMLDLVGLTGQAGRPPHTLSGGQQQRVALARALAVEPSLLLLDEPFNALDAVLRQELCRDVRRILKARDATAILVTHDRDEAFGLADQVAVMDAGRIVQVGTPRAVYREPASLVAASLTGAVLRLPGTLIGTGVETPLGRLPAMVRETLSDGRVVVVLRPEQIVPAPPGQGVSATVLDQIFLGPRATVELSLPTGSDPLTVKANWPADRDYAAGADVAVAVAGAASVFPVQ
ncbi:ABC transporter ATP-binding protein [Lichenihabitans sp. Uapishka_5]|uniref:ABC transporter ATP-binding protein n=1 Tax=Lichenihabitans sp. Uapishka_5 TaxID=3037302 RepID=UPI0029E80E95|nr:ABC transporter ATP-binding protein [Lichenihabitans sp. Uapishka_5]MDX7950446.1 ABC transporter ATP-binding protein [Lichenihabitans sp. Uapishka_5]